jgi:APA family basic amino acid/polyamine antiporter
MGSSQHSGLVRVIGRWTLVGLVLNATIGSGIFGLPSLVSGHLGKQSPWAYLAAAAGMGVIMACFAEVGSRFREAGGPYLYAREAFGRFAGIQMAWVSWLVRLTAAAANANLFVIYCAEFWPPATNRLPRFVILSLLIGIPALINYRGVRAGAQFSNVFIVSKLLPLTLFALVGLFFLRTDTIAAPSLAAGGGWPDAVLVLVFAYGGFEAALFPMSEAKNPQRDVPFALFTTLAVMTVLYTAIQLAVQSALAAPEQADRPLAAAATIFLGPAGAAFMTVGALVSVYGYLGSMMLNVPRLTYALAEKNDFPRPFATVHRRFHTPHVSIVVFGLMVWGLAVAGTFKWNVTLSAVARLLTYALTCAAVIALRRQQPGKEAFHLPAGGFISLVGIAFSLALITRMDRTALLIVAVTMSIGVVNWLWARRDSRRPVGPSAGGRGDGSPGRSIHLER